MANGWVYILTNPCMPGLVKIGFTTTSVEQRRVELSTPTSCPLPFDVFASFPADNVAELESKCHIFLDDFRVNEYREFFYLTPDVARRLIEYQIAVDSVAPPPGSLPVDDKKIGQLIRKLRKAGKFSLKDVAKQSGLRQETICRYENSPETMEGISFRSLLKIIAVLGYRIVLSPIDTNTSNVPG